MAIQISPHPNDGPLKASAPSHKFVVRVTTLTTFVAVARTPKGRLIRIKHDFLLPGINHITLHMPPGGVPPGTTMRVVMQEWSGKTTGHKYTFK